MKDKENSSKASNLRQIAEGHLKNKAQEKPSIPAEIDILKLVHELDVHQIELEMQNEELLLAKKNAEFNAEKFQELYDFAPSGYFTLSKDGVIIAVNLRGAELLSRERIFLIKSHFSHFISDETRPTFILFLETVFNSKSKQSCEVHIRLNKNTITYDVYLTGVTSEDGEQCYITMLDISKLKRAEAEINEKEKKYRTLFDSNRDSVTVFRLGPDGKLGSFIVANKATSEIFGYSNEELMTMTFKKLEPASVKKRKERIAVLLSKKNINFETFIKTKKGNRRNVEVEALIINYENEPAVMNIIRDVTERKQMEANSRKAQENLLTILEAIPDLLFEVDSTGKIYHYQSPQDNLLAVPPSEFMGKSFSEVLPSEATTIIMEALQEANKNGRSSGKQYALELAKGKYWFELSVSLIKESSTKEKHFIVLARDITERKLSELALTNEKRRLAVILIGTGAGTWEWNIQTGETIFNEQWAEIIGYTLEELAPISIDTWEKYTHPDDFKHSEELLEKHFKGELDYYECEVRMKHKNGNWIWIVDRGKINEWDIDGKPLLMSGTHVNVTERKLAENNLLNNQALTDATLESIQSGILAIDHHGKVIKTNNKFVEMWRIPNEIINTKDDKILLNFILEQLIHPEDFKSKVTELYKNHHEESLDLLYFKDGRIFERVSKPMYVEVVTMGRVWSFLDITERKLSEKAKEDALNLIHNINSHVPGVVYQYLLRPDGSSCFPYASDGIKEIYHVTPEEVREDASKAFENIHPDDYTVLVASIQKSADDLTPWKHQYSVKYKDGEVRYLLGNAIPQKLADGSVLWNGYITDITDNKIAENSLRESEEKYRSLVENSPDGVIIYKEGRIVFANEEARHMVGAKTKNKLIGKPVLQFIHPDSQKSVVRKMEELLIDKNSSQLVEEKFIRLDGTPFDVEIKAIPTVYEHKNAIQVIVHDITQRKKSALELTKINRVYALISQINNLIIRTHNQEELFQEICNIAVNFGKFRMSWIGLIAKDNKTLKTATFAGYENGYFTKSNITTISDEPEGRGPTGIATREARTVICNDIENDPIMKPWRNDALERGYHSSISIPLMVRNKIIGAFNLYSEETNFFSSEEEISLLEKIILNISFALEKILVEEDRKKTEEKIHQLSQAVEQSPVTIVITNTKGDIEYANPKFLETSGYTMEEVVGQNSRILKSGYTSAEEYKELWHSLAIGKEWHGEFHNKRKDGSLYWESASISPIVNSEGRTTHYIAIKEDITNRKLIQKELLKSKNKAEESDRLKLAFLANMSHEIRTPMNGILGFTELLKEPKLSGKEQQEYINIIEKSGKRMLNIINDIISISKVESGQIDISLKETNINEQIEYLYTFFNPEAKLKGIQLNLPKMLLAEDSLVKTDREKVYAILTNLVKNAIKFTNEGTIEFGCEKKEGMLEFFVKDSGLGISKSQQKMVFERFRQVNETISRSHEGSGLGLAISKAYAELLGGKIWVKSKEGKGSTFYFTIPFYPEYKSKEITITKKEDTAVKEENKIKNLKVLIVEDDAISKLLVTIAVKPFSKEILKVSTGFEAIEACRNNPDIDLVMMDINMPEMGGYEATKQIRESKKDLIIIAQTANGMQSDRDNAIAAGCTDYISKPINIKTLGELIQKYFKK